MVDIRISVLTDFSQAMGFEDALSALLEQVDSSSGVPIRLVFFVKEIEKSGCSKLIQQLREAVVEKWSTTPPLVTLVAQPLLGDSQLEAEVWQVEERADVQLYYRQLEGAPYLMIEDRMGRHLLMGHIATAEVIPIDQQTEQVMHLVERILQRESMTLNAIVRQWNYIEEITRMNEGYQHYQLFNDVRSDYYAKSSWENGYPAATGIGTDGCGVVVDLHAFAPKNVTLFDAPIDNELQVAAHVYSQEVLLGSALAERRTTPKFERARILSSAESGVVFVSGTAAIRGELSLRDVGIEEQTRITMENVNYLIASRKLDSVGMQEGVEARLGAIRVYLKEADDYQAAKALIGAHWGEVPAIYTVADVCRDELLIEIEGVAYVRTIMN